MKKIMIALLCSVLMTMACNNNADTNANTQTKDSTATKDSVSAHPEEMSQPH